MGHDIERLAGSLERLHQKGDLADQSSKALEAPNVKAAIARGLGERSSADELLLATILVDDSMSIAAHINEIRGGHNNMLAALQNTTTSAEVRVQTRAFTQGILSPYRPIAQAMVLDERTFSGRSLAQYTPLYQQSVITLGTVMAKTQDEESRGAKVRTFTLIITDAEDNRSRDITAKDVHCIITDMTQYMTNHIVAGMGVGERPEARGFGQIFSDMGIQKRWQFTSACTSEEIRKEFERIVNDLQLAAASETEFLQLTAGSSDD